jgi:hypothetical protein
MDPREGAAQLGQSSCRLAASAVAQQRSTRSILQTPTVGTTELIASIDI